MACLSQCKHTSEEVKQASRGPDIPGLLERISSLLVWQQGVHQKALVNVVPLMRTCTKL